MSLKDIVDVLGGEVHRGGNRAHIPAPGHSTDDRSVSLLLQNNRLIIHSFTDGGDWRAIRDDLRERGFINAAGELVGAVYADSDMLGRIFTTLDAQLLRAFAQQAALTLVAARVDGRLAALSDCLALGQPDGS